MRFTLTKITAKKPLILSKSYALTEDGTLQKSSGGVLIAGLAERKKLDLNEFAVLLSTLGPKEALVYGVSAHDTARIVPKVKLSRQSAINNRQPVIARDRKHFSWPIGPGILMLDYDPEPGVQPLKRN